MRSRPTAAQTCGATGNVMGKVVAVLRPFAWQQGAAVAQTQSHANPVRPSTSTIRAGPADRQKIQTFAIFHRNAPAERQGHLHAHAEHQTNEGRRWEESGKIPKVMNSWQFFSQAALLSYAVPWANRRLQIVAKAGEAIGWCLLQALCALTARHAESGNPTPMFIAERLRGEVAQIVRDT